MRTLLPLLRIAALIAWAVAFVATWRALSSTGMPDPEGMSADALWWYTNQDDIRQVGLVILGAALVTMFVPAMLVTLGGAFMVAAYAWIVGESSPGLEQAGAWWIFAAALVVIALVRRVVRPRRRPAAVAS
ncbi:MULTISPECIES: hypothetical protein [Mumia]|uniref:hypothetical protein n=1 Tax=Mumia TaxID=1546255 RepID=UPI00141E3EAD|nr:MULTISPECIES: hypothetical protein [unclassified Mumia]QMW65486.1 hypothetical protein H4N58_14960 [Mumia sp. ZJ1417]